MKWNCWHRQCRNKGSCCTGRNWRASPAFPSKFSQEQETHCRRWFRSRQQWCSLLFLALPPTTQHTHGHAKEWEADTKSLKRQGEKLSAPPRSGRQQLKQLTGTSGAQFHFKLEAEISARMGELSGSKLPLAESITWGRSPHQAAEQQTLAVTLPVTWNPHRGTALPRELLTHTSSVRNPLTASNELTKAPAEDSPLLLTGEWLLIIAQI